MVSKLHDILKPFLLRRVKADVENSLPAKQEIILYAPLTSEQVTIQKKLVDKTLISEVTAMASKSGKSVPPPSVLRHAVASLIVDQRSHAASPLHVS